MPLLEMPLLEMPLLEMHAIDKQFGGVAALSGADFTVSTGEVHALIGQNGAGKSTLIKILTGYYRRDAGTITFGGRAFAAASPQDAQRSGISTIHQEINLVGLRSVAENICLGREPRRFGMLDWRGMKREAEALLARFDVDVDVGQPLDRCSTATQQMVAIARAIGFRARLVIMDEPTSSLTEREVDILFGVIRQLRGADVSVVFVSHKLDELYAVCDRVTIMRDGRTVATGSMAELPKTALVAQMLGRNVTRQGATGFGLKGGGAGATVLEAVGLRAAPRVTHVDLHVARGEIVGLTGLLGAGRTETAQLIAGASTQDAGEMTFKGAPFRPSDPAEALRAGIGYVSEDRKLDGIVPDLSVGENLTLALLPALSRAGVVDSVAQRRIVARYIERLGIRCAGPDQPIRQLSGGNQQKVLLARSLCLDPALVILDEPTRGIDVGAKAELQAEIRTLADAGLAVLMISSEMEEIIEGADRAYVMRDGRIVAELAGPTLTEGAVMDAMAHDV